MCTAVSNDVTKILAAVRNGDDDAVARLFPVVYDELRRLARQRMAKETPGHTLQTTALVHEAYLRLVKDPDTRWEERGHFYAAAAVAMRRILIEHARQRKALKYGGGRRRVPLSKVDIAGDEGSVDVLVLDKALDRLEKLDQRTSQVVMLRYFAGLTVDETAKFLGVTDRTVKRDWRCARAWLLRELTKDQPEGE